MPEHDRRIRSVPDDVWNWHRAQATLRGLQMAEWLALIKHEWEKAR